MPSEPLKLPVSEWKPDLPDAPGGEGSATVLNVYPRTPESYGPVGTPMPQYGALMARCQGGAAYHDKLANTYVVAGDVNDLYLLQAGLDTWANASKVPGGYAANDQTWRFAYFNNQIIATDFGDNPQVITLGVTGSFTDLGGSPPRAKHIAIVKNEFVVLGNTYDPLNGDMPQRVWWSAAGNANDWPVLGSDDAAAKQSSSNDLLGPGGEVRGFAADLTSADAVVFQEFAVRRMTYAGPPDIFTFLPVESAVGCFAADSIVVNGGIAYYWGQDGIYAFNGGESKPIGANKVDKTVYADLDIGNVARVVGASDPLNKLIWWAYPSRQNVGGNPDRLLIYNWQLDRFSLAEITAETVVKLLGIGYTLDQLFTLFGYTVDTVPAPFDSPVWLGGRLQFGLFDSDHKLNFLTGTPLAATVDTTELQVVPGRRAHVRNARPLVDGVGAVPSVSLGLRDRVQDAVTYTTASALNSLGTCPQRASGRYMRARTTVPAGNIFWENISGVELDLAAQGVR